MKLCLAAAAILWLGAASSFAHRLDEYLQGTIVSVEKNQLHAQVMLTPGVAVFSDLFADIDTNSDGTISPEEQRAYALRFLSEVSLAIDGHLLSPRLLAYRFPETGEMKEGRGEIQLEFDADLPPGGPNRKLTFENHHESRISVYQVNCLAPRDPDIRIVAQNRNYLQSHYELDYVQGAVSVNWLASVWLGASKWLGTGALILLGWLMLLRRQRA